MGSSHPRAVFFKLRNRGLPHRSTTTLWAPYSNFPSADQWTITSWNLSASRTKSLASHQHSFSVSLFSVSRQTFAVRSKHCSLFLFPKSLPLLSCRKINWMIDDTVTIHHHPLSNHLSITCPTFSPHTQSPFYSPNSWQNGFPPRERPLLQLQREMEFIPPLQRLYPSFYCRPRRT